MVNTLLLSLKVIVVSTIPRTLSCNLDPYANKNCLLLAEACCDSDD